ncbi:MAG: Flp pilus assembly protein CpaB [Myxococcaceae bacterium]
MTKGRTPLIIGVVLGLLSFVIGWSGLQKARADARKGFNLVPVVVAAVDVSEGTVITMEMIQQRSIPETFVTASVIKPDSVNYVIGQKVMVSMQSGDPLLWSQFESSRASEHLTTKVLKRTRAVTIAANTTSSVGGWVRPNDHVDIIGTFKDPDSNEQVALTLMQNVVVLATGKLTGNTNMNLVPENERTYANVTLMVVPEEGEVLTLAQELGNLTLALRNDEELGTIDQTRPTTIRTLFDGERRRKVNEIRNTIEIIRGSGGSKEGAK